MSSSFQKFGGALGFIAGLAGLAYLAFFVILKDPSALPSALALLAVGLCASGALVALYYRVRETDEGFALWGLLLGLAGAGGAAVHAAFDVAGNLHPPQTPFAYASLIDPRGFLTFAVSGLAAIVLSGLIVRGGRLPRTLGFIGIVSGLLLIALYVGYMVILNASNSLVLFLVLTSGLIQPLWYLWLGAALWGARSMPSVTVGYDYRGGATR